MKTTVTDSNWFAHRPWAIPVILVLAAVSLGLDLAIGDRYNMVRTAAFFTAALTYVLYQRTGAKAYLWCAFAAAAVVCLMMVLRVGVKLGWW